MGAMEKINSYLRHETSTGIQMHEFDAFRGWAVLCVLFFHIIIISKYPREPVAAWEIFLKPFFLGWGGVDLFFFLSGFLLFLGFGKAYYEGKPFPSRWSFYKRRFFRIAPAYYACMAIMLALSFLMHHRVKVTPADVLYHVFFLHNLNVETSRTINGVLWTLAIEMQFYLVLPFLAVFFLGRRWRISLPVIICASALYKILVIWLDHFYPVSPYIKTAVTPFNGLLWRLDQFAIGMSFSNLWLYLKYNKDAIPEFMKRPRTNILMIIGGLAAVVALLDYHRLHLEGEDLYWLVVTTPATAAAFGFVVLMTLYSDVAKKLLTINLIQFLGIISYSIYLWHNFIIEGLTRYFPFFASRTTSSYLLLIALSLCVTVIMGLLSYILFERPFLKKSSPSFGVGKLLSLYRARTAREI